MEISGAVPTAVTITFYSGVGLLASETQVVQPGDSATFYQPSNTNLPNGLVGSATMTSDGQAIVAIVNQVNYLLGGDAAMATVREGLRARRQAPRRQVAERYVG